jgi:tetratricopeptide (TPR) repeat protein
MQDQFGTDIAAQHPQTLVAWNTAMSEYLGFRGSPVAHLADIDDPEFYVGPAFCAAMMVLSGLDPNGPDVQTHLHKMTRAAPHGAPHAHAVTLLSHGAFTRAARVWDQILVDHPTDILALKCSHETWFLTGNATSMRASTTAALGRIDPDHPAYPVAAAQHGFALEETGDYAAAECWGRLAITQSPNDCWALHCLAHVYETQNRHHDAMTLLHSKQPIWRDQNLLSAHIWWHLALRLIEMGDFDAALAVFDDTLAGIDPDNRFRLTDGTSLLWRLELAGVDVGDRWRGMAENWAANATLHTNGFLDLHAALAFARCPNMPAADLFFDSLATAFGGGTSENAAGFAQVVKPLATAMRAFPDDPKTATAQITPLLSDLYRLGGSIVQREIVERSYSSALIATGATAQCAAWLDPQIDRHPNTPWLLRDRARCAETMGDTAQATLLRRRSDLMFAGVS